MTPDVFMAINTHEDLLVRTFIERTKRDRYLQLLDSPRRRKKVLDTLFHSITFDERYSTDVPSKTDAYSLLRTKGAPETCYVMSPYSELDRREMSLAEALELGNHGIFSGILISCVPGRLAYYCGEEGERRILLEKPKPT